MEVYHSNEGSFFLDSFQRIATKRFAQALEPRILTAALIDSTTLYGSDGGISPWLGGVDVSKFPGSTTGQKIANAAKSIRADILSPAAVDNSSTAPDPSQAGYVPFTTKEMIEEAHKNGLVVSPWTVCILGCRRYVILTRDYF